MAYLPWRSAVLRLYSIPHWLMLTSQQRSASTWPSRFVESSGNYEEDAFLELSSETPLYAHQSNLPRLPVPTLEETMDRFLPTALPLAESKEESDSLQEACGAFLTEAQPLQDRLLRRYHASPNTSWLQQWWNTLGYLHVRDSVVVNVSYFFMLDDAPIRDVENSWSAVRRGAAALHAVAEFRQMVVSGDWPTDTMMGAGRRESAETPLCSAAYKYLFHGCRIPRLLDEGGDTYRMYDPNLYTHAIVAYRNQFYAMPLLNEDDDGRTPLPIETLEQQLQACMDLAKSSSSSSSSSSSNCLELGWLTSWNRDDWARARETLLTVGGTEMEQALERLESCMVMLCLDEEEPVSYNDRAIQFWHGGRAAGGNRWFDKSIQLIVTKNAKLSYVGEHSMADGMPAESICQHILHHEKKLAAQEQQQQQSEGEFVTTTANHNHNNNNNKSREVFANQDTKSTVETSSSSSRIENIFQDAFDNLSERDMAELQGLVDKAIEDFVKLTSEQDMQVLHFQGYGSNFIKSAKFSPDAYVQMAIQLASYRLFHKQVATYEATQTRPFLHGRTETTRSVSPESAAFVKAMGLHPTSSAMRVDDDEARSRKIELLREATASHVQYIRSALQGRGVDRHFFGLSMLVDKDEEAPALFSHPLFLRSKRWRVTSSTLLKTKPGFGEVVPDGVGIGYDVERDACFFIVASRTECDYTGRLCHLLEEALLEMREMLVEQNVVTADKK